MTLEGRRRLMTEVGKRIGGDLIHCSFVFHPLEPNEKPVGSSLAEDLASIYEDLYEGVELLAAGGAVEDVIWSWRFNFQSHWGQHALAALQALNATLRDSRVAARGFGPEGGKADGEHRPTAAAVASQLSLTLSDD